MRWGGGAHDELTIAANQSFYDSGWLSYESVYSTKVWIEDQYNDKDWNISQSEMVNIVSKLKWSGVHPGASSQ